MICEDPYVSQGIVYGCGQCMPCRYNRRRVWAHRIMLEAAQYEMNCFLTLTYDDKHMPEDRSLEPKHLTDFLKRLRYHFKDKIRYFACGEYGDDTMRPHYHLALFNFATCRLGQTRYNKGGIKCDVKELRLCQCFVVKEIWGYGNVYLGKLEQHSAQYVSGYVVKKMTHRQDQRLNGRHPEFARMSLKPGIGAPAMSEVASVCLSNPALDGTDVTSIDYGKRSGSRPLGQYLTRRLRLERGLSEKAPQSAYDKIAEELRPMRLAARASVEVPGLKGQFLKAKAPSLRSFHARRRLYQRSKKL